MCKLRQSSSSEQFQTALCVVAGRIRGHELRLAIQFDYEISWIHQKFAQLHSSFRRNTRRATSCGMKQNIVAGSSEVSVLNPPRHSSTTYLALAAIILYTPSIRPPAIDCIIHSHCRFHSCFSYSPTIYYHPGVLCLFGQWSLSYCNWWLILSFLASNKTGRPERNRVYTTIDRFQSRKGRQDSRRQLRTICVSMAMSGSQHRHGYINAKEFASQKKRSRQSDYQQISNSLGQQPLPVL